MAVTSGQIVKRAPLGFGLLCSFPFEIFRQTARGLRFRIQAGSQLVAAAAGRGCHWQGSLPTIEILRSNVVDGTVVVSITAASTGRYRYQFTVPGGYDAGDFVAVIASATVDGLLDVGTLVDTRLVAMDWMAVSGGGGLSLESVSPSGVAALRASLAGLPIATLALPSTPTRGVLVIVQGDDYSIDDGTPIPFVCPETILAGWTPVLVATFPASS